LPLCLEGRNILDSKTYPRKPVHASGLNQVESSFSIVQRQGFTPNDFPHLEAVAQRLRLYEARANRQPRPFKWLFTRAKLSKFLKRLEV